MQRDELLHSLAARGHGAHVVDAIAAVPRELFVTAPYRAAAYVDAPLRIGHGQTISQPAVVARMCELLELVPTDRVLDVGTGSGYHAAVLSRLCDTSGASSCTTSSLSAPRDRCVARASRTSRSSPATARSAFRGRPRSTRSTSPRRRSGSCRRALERQLAVGGRLVAPIADDDGEHLVLVRRLGDGFERTPLEPVRFVPLL